MPEGTYDAAVVKAFGMPTLRTAFVIDDQFPSYSELVIDSGSTKPRSEVERAKALYEFFHSQMIPCDIANWSAALQQQDIERIRKTDLIVLDYNLAEDNIEISIDIMRRLSQSSHFNTIILYTQADNLNVVWQEIAASLRGDWKSAESFVEPTGQIALWESIVDDIDLDGIDDAVLESHITDMRTAESKAGEERLRGQLDALKVPPAAREQFLKGIVSQRIRNRFGDVTALAENARHDVKGRCGPKVRWLQSGHCFIAIMGKTREVGTNEGRVEVSRIFECLNEALIDWRPNVLQIILAELQNILELQALATTKLQLNDPEMQLGLAYYLLWSMSEDLESPDPAMIMPALHLTVDKLVETIRIRAAGDPDLMSAAAEMLAGELTRIGWVSRPEGSHKPRMFTAATDLARLEAPRDEKTVLLQLNEFLASEPFRRLSPTTGTILLDESSREYIMCASPACDMVARPPNASQLWMSAMHPLRPMVGVHLESKEKATSAVEKAELGKYVFIKVDGMMTALSLMPAEQPVTEFFFLDYGSGVAKEAGSDNVYLEVFRIVRVPGTAEVAGTLRKSRLRIISQVRDAYANRFLQMTGNHLSRIGVDFVQYTPPGAAKAKQA